GVATRSVHVLLAMCSAPNAAHGFLVEHGVRIEHVFALARPTQPEAERIWATICQRAERLARRATQRAAPPESHCAVEPMHVLAALLREPRCQAYRVLEAAGLTLGGVHAQALRRAMAVEQIDKVERSANTSPPLAPARRTPMHSVPGVHPSLERLTQKTPGPAPEEGPKPRTPPGRTRRNRSRSDDHSSPVHPALRDAWLRTTPACGMPAIRVQDARELAGGEVAQSPAQPSPQDHSNERLPKTLKERFAELKQRAKRKSRTPSMPPADIKLPPSIVRAQPAPHTSAQSEALEDAQATTRSLAARLFAKPKEPTPEEDAPEHVEHEAPSEHISHATVPPKTKARPDAELAKTYALDPKTYPVLSKFGRNLTEEAALGRIDLVIGRDRETTQLIDILGKRRGNNPMLVGDAGVGKTAIAEGLALTFCELARKGVRTGKRTIVELEIGRILSGTHLRGSLSERLIQIKDEVRQADGQIIVFLDEIHTWLGSGASGDGNDAAGELKTALARGQLPCIGATTRDEYVKFIEADPAMERRFQVVDVEEPDMATAITIARGVREHYERYHHITYADAAVEAAVRLSHRYIHDRRLPDKAISVLDLAGSRAARTGRQAVARADVAHIVAEMASLPPDRLMRSDR
ncbi:MAG: AAA family ATPase, partial [Myxococcota bacterium]